MGSIGLIFQNACNQLFELMYVAYENHMEGLGYMNPAHGVV